MQGFSCSILDHQSKNPRASVVAGARGRYEWNVGGAISAGIPEVDNAGHARQERQPRDGYGIHE